MTIWACNYGFSSDPNSSINDPIKMFFYSLMTLSDSAILLYYLTIGNNIWKGGALAWQGVPKAFWCLALWFLHPDKGQVLFCIWVMTSMVSAASIVTMRETMMATHFHADMILQGADGFGTVEFFTCIHLDVPFIFKAVWLNISDEIARSQRIKGTKI